MLLVVRAGFRSLITRTHQRINQLRFEPHLPVC
jgi:hypothetical protein